MHVFCSGRLQAGKAGSLREGLARSWRTNDDGRFVVCKIDTRIGLTPPKKERLKKPQHGQVAFHRSTRPCCRGPSGGPSTNGSDRDRRRRSISSTRAPQPGTRETAGAWTCGVCLQAFIMGYLPHPMLHWRMSIGLVRSPAPERAGRRSIVRKPPDPVSIKHHMHALSSPCVCPLVVFHPPPNQLNYPIPHPNPQNRIGNSGPAGQASQMGPAACLAA